MDKKIILSSFIVGLVAEQVAKYNMTPYAKRKDFRDFDFRDGHGEIIGTEYDDITGDVSKQYVLQAVPVWANTLSDADLPEEECKNIANDYFLNSKFEAPKNIFKVPVKLVVAKKDYELSDVEDFLTLDEFVDEIYKNLRFCYKTVLSNFSKAES